MLRERETLLPWLGSYTNISICKSRIIVRIIIILIQLVVLYLIILDVLLLYYCITKYEQSYHVPFAFWFSFFFSKSSADYVLPTSSLSLAAE